MTIRSGKDLAIKKSGSYIGAGQGVLTCQTKPVKKKNDQKLLQHLTLN